MKAMVGLLVLGAAAAVSQETFEHKLHLLHGVPAHGTVQFMAAGPMAGQPVAGAPYSAEGVTDYVRTLADGTRITRRTTAKFARDGQGRTREETSLPGLGPWASTDGTRLVTITDPVAREVYILNERDKTARKIALPGKKFRAAPAHGEGVAVKVDRRVEVRSSGRMAAASVMVAGARSGNAKVATEQLGSQTMEGLAVTGERTTSTVAAGESGNDRPLVSTSERWESTELKVTVRSITHDPEFGDTTYRLTNINRAEPAKSLFQVPADYKVEEGPALLHFESVTKKP
jgi:hypothetical protein